MIQLAENTVVADRFRLVRMIGRGGMGSVWQAVHIGLDTPCALKFIEGELIKIAEAHERFEREAKVSAQLRSPHIVQIIDHGVWQGRPYIAMELLEGTDLGKLIHQNGGKLPPAQVNTIIQQVCRALTKAHAAGIVHRDLKPDNIFVSMDDDRIHVKILDFGVAKATGQAIENSNTKTGAMLGTPYYMSPEQAQGIKSIDSRSDLWSVAVITYQCLVGRLPFESEALGDLLVKIIVQPIPVPSQMGSVPPGFDKWWAKSADRNPDHRYPTAKELSAALELALNLTAGIGPPIALPGAPPSDPMMQTAVLGASPPMNTPAPHMPTPPPNMGSGGMPAYAPPQTPATFSGVEAGVPKKGMPVALIAAFAALAIIGIGGAGIAMAKRSSGSSGPAPSGSVTSTAGTTTATAPPPTAEKTAETPAPPPSTEASATPPEPESSASPSARTNPTAPPGTAPTAPAHTTVAQAPAAGPAPAPKPGPAPTGSAKKKWDPGF